MVNTNANSASKRTQSINFVAHNILLCFNSFALAPAHTHTHPEFVPFFWAKSWLVAWACDGRGRATADAATLPTRPTRPTRLRICNNVAKVSTLTVLALCAPSVTNMHMFNYARKRFDNNPHIHDTKPPLLSLGWRWKVILTNLVFDFCIMVLYLYLCSSSNMAKDLSTLGWDYFMFAAFIALTVLGPLWTRIFGKSKQRSKADYVFATGGVSLVAVMISIARGTLGVRSVLGKLRAQLDLELYPLKSPFPSTRLPQWTLLSRLGHVGDNIRHDECLSHCLLHVCARLL